MTMANVIAPSSVRKIANCHSRRIRQHTSAYVSIRQHTISHPAPSERSRTAVHAAGVSAIVLLY
jgi:hypothetical protein